MEAITTPHAEGIQEAIIASAAVLVLREGFAQKTGDDFAAAANVSREEFDRHFESTDALLDAIIRNLQAKLSERITQALHDRTTNPVQRLRELFRDLPRLFTGPSQVFLRDMRRLRPDIIDKIIDFRRARLRSLASILSEGISRGEITDAIHPQVTIDTLIAIVDTVLVPDYALKRGTALEVLLPQVFQLFLGGVMAPVHSKVMLSPA